MTVRALPLPAFITSTTPEHRPYPNAPVEPPYTADVPSMFEVIDSVSQHAN
jgi:hypothetical protein